MNHSSCAIQVADVLDDGRIDEWAKLAAYSIPPDTNYLAGDCTPEEASRAMATLSNTLRSRVLASAAVNSVCLHRMLDFLPSHDHATVLEATITDTKTLEAPLRDALKVAKALPSLPASPPSFLSLSVHDYEPGEPITPDSPAAAQATTCLVQALQHHSGLTSLQMKLPCITSASLEQLAPAIACLTALQSLLLHSGIGPDSLPTLQQTFHTLPQLQHLSISLSSSDTRKRQRDDESAPALSHCLVPMLSAASALTSLDLFTVCESACSFQATSILTMPQLRQLALRFDTSHTLSCASILGALRAPLTSLNILHDKGLSLPPEAVQDIQKLFASFATFTALQSLALATPIDDDSAGRVDGELMAGDIQAPVLSTLPGDDPAELGLPSPTLPPGPGTPRTCVIHDAVSSGVPTTLAALPRLASLTLSTDVAAMHAAAPVMATALTQLTALTVTLSSRENDWGEWPALLGHLAQLPLQRLQMTLKRTAMDLPGLAALPPVPHLTALYVDNWACIASAEDCEALARMTQLHKLHLLAMRVPEELCGDCAHSLGELPALTSLVFRSGTPEGCISGVLGDHVPVGALTTLRELGLDIWGRFDERGDDEEEEEEDEEEDGSSSAITMISNAGLFANRLPAVMLLDLVMEDDGSAGPQDDLSEWVHDVEIESDRELEVSLYRDLAF